MATEPTSTDAGNPAKPVRDEDAFDVEAVAAWLRENATPPGWSTTTWTAPRRCASSRAAPRT